MRPSRQAIAISTALIAAGSAAVWSARSQNRGVDAGFWFETVVFGAKEPMADRLGGPITADEMGTIERIAFSETVHAFDGFNISVTKSREAAYRMRVVQSLRFPFAPKMLPPSAESRAIAGFGGMGAINFQLLANSAIAYAPEDADRQAMIAAIGRGIGRAAAHEFAHQFLGAAPIHDSRDIRSYEYRSADRREQYYGEMHWDLAAPLLERRLGRRN